MPIAVVLVVSAALPPLIKPLLVRLGVVDVPNERSSHTVPAIRGMGLAPLIAMVVGYALLFFVPEFEGFRALFGVLVSVAAASALLGWVEDSIGVGVVLRATLQLVIGIAGGAAACLLLDTAEWLLPFFAIGIAGYINVANFMDGIDGISGLHGGIVGCSFAALGLLAGQTWMIPTALILAAAFIGFLPWNLSRRGIFLGDAGSYLLGGGIAIIAVLAASRGVPVLALLGPVFIYLLDTTATLVRRVVRRERWYEAHRSHIYQRLTDHGLSHIVVSCLIALMSAMTAGAGLLSLSQYLWILSASLMALVGTIYLALPLIFDSVRSASKLTRA